jgi:uncharacterized protein (TIGR02145 family)
MKKRILILSLGLLFLASITFSLANISFSPGRVLSPAERKSLSSPREAFDIMQKLGLGISKADLDRFLATKFPERLAGVILISVEEDGRAYYIHPDTLEAIYLGRPHEALDILRELGLEDTLLDNNNDDINNIILETQKIEELKDFSHIIPITTNIINPDNISIKERGIIYDYSVLPDIKLVPSLDDYEDKVIDDTVNTNNSYTLNIQNLVPGTYPFFRAYLITSDNQIIYGNTITITSTRNDQTEESALPLPLLPISSSGSSVKEWICGDDFIDERDGEIYRTVKIDDECWFQDNLRTTLYNDGSPIPITPVDYNVYDVLSTFDPNSDYGLYSWYNNDEANSRNNNYGALYNWGAAVNACPDGWHLPSKQDFLNLMDGRISQDFRDTSWSDGNNSTGFSALPTGIRMDIFDSQGFMTSFWTRTTLNNFSDRNYGMLLTKDLVSAEIPDDELFIEAIHKLVQMPVRCLQDSPKTITYKSSDGGKIHLGDEILKDEIVVTAPFGEISPYEITAIPNDNYHFVKWSDFNTSSNRLDNIDDNITITAEFVKKYEVCGDIFFDARDRELYRTVEIDNECWFQDNLRTTLYNDGSPISTSNDLNEIMSTSSGLYSWYDNDEENSRSHNYGALYNFAAVVDSRGLCPDGWHLPSILEFEELIKGKNHQDLKDTSWDASSNSSGFSALPAGFRAGMTGTSEAFDLQGHAIGFYTKTIDSESSSNAWALALFNPGVAACMGINEMSFHKMPKMLQGSVRCIEDNVKTITYKSSDGGKISLDDGALKDEIVITVPFGGSHNQEIIATPNSDYTFTKWSDYNTSSTRLGENNVTDNIVLTTEFFKDDPIFDCGDKVLDTRDMEIYKTVQIGEQCWFQDNLRYLPVVHDNATYTNLTNDNKPSYGVLGYDGNDLLAAKNYKIGYNNFTFQAYPILGVLYNVSAVDQVTLCPNGWKIPNDNDWIKLAKTISGETSCDFWNHTTPCWKIAEKLKSSSNDIIPWTGTNDFGFTALPVGVRQSDGRFTDLGTRTIFSADTSSDLGYVLANENNWTGAGEYMALAGKQYSPNGYSIRCIKE